MRCKRVPTHRTQCPNAERSAPVPYNSQWKRSSLTYASPRTTTAICSRPQTLHDALRSARSLSWRRSATAARRTADARPAADGATRGERFPLRQRHANRLRARRSPAFADLPGIIVSGINLGRTWAMTRLSGTAAATEGYCSIPAIAIWRQSGRISSGRGRRRRDRRAFQRREARPGCSTSMSRPAEKDLTGTEVTRLGKRHKAEPVSRRRARAATRSTGSALDPSTAGRHRFRRSPSRIGDAVRIDPTHYEQAAGQLAERSAMTRVIRAAR
jgi:hypothetical protein